MEFRGRIYKVFPVQSGTSQRGNEWRKQDFIFEYFEHETDRWSDKVLLSVLNERIDEYDLHEGDECIIGFGHTVSNEWKGRVFNEIRLYKFEKVKGATAEPSPTEKAGGGTQAAVTQQAQAGQPMAANGMVPGGDKDDELPF